MSLSPKAVNNLAKSLKVEAACIWAVYQVEASGEAFLPDGRPKILFERHVFWKELIKRYYNPDQLLIRQDVKDLHGDISDILSRKAGGYKGGVKEYERFDRALQICADAAKCSCSWGAFQIMGYHFADLGYEDVDDLIEDMKSGYDGQLTVLGKFLVANELVDELQRHDWKGFARGYNGSGYTRNAYDKKLSAAYNKYRKSIM